MRIFIFFVLCLLCSCGSADEISYSDLSLNEKNIDFYDCSLANDKIYLSGGDLWLSGVLFEFDGLELTKVNEVDKSITSTFYYEDKSLSISTAFSGRLFLEEDNLDWKRLELPTEQILKSSSHGNNHFAVVGGHGFRDGVALIFDENFNLLSLTEFYNELSDVAYSEKLKQFFAVGFGQIVRYDFNESTWTILDIEGDHFKDVQFIGSTGWVLGRAGTVLKTENGGESWNELVDQKAWSNISAMNRLFFKDPENGLIVGDDGMIWKTTNGGDDWVEYKLKDAEDLNGVIINSENQVFVVGLNGFIAQFDF